MPLSFTGITLDLNALQVRCGELGLPADEGGRVVDELAKFMHDVGYAPVRFEALIAAVDGREDDPDWHEWVWTQIVEPAEGAFDLQGKHQRLLREGLEAAAQRGVPTAHFAIAKMLQSEAMLYGDEEERIRRQVKREGTWTSPYVSFADIEANGLRIEEKHRHHLLAAARSGDIRAQMETAEMYGDPAVLQRTPSDRMDPLCMIEIADEHEHNEKLRYWLTVAAQAGDIDAMRELIIDHDEPIEQAWVWMHLSRLLELDLSQSRHQAINEDGTPYDDDVGGPIHVIGDDGIDLDPLPARADSIARRAAGLLFARINTEGDRI